MQKCVNLKNVFYINRNGARAFLNLNICIAVVKKTLCLFTSRFGLCSVVLLKELWHGNIIPGEDSRNNSKEMKELLGYMARHHEDLEKSFTDEQKEIFEKFHDCWSEYMSLAEAAIFEYAFKLGMNLAIESQI